MSLELLIHNIGYIISALTTLVVIILVYIKDHGPLANKMLLLSFVAVFGYVTSHVVGVNIQDPELSRTVLMGNIFTIFIALFFAHSVFALIGKLKEQKIALIFMYSGSIILTIIFLIFPNSLLLPSVPKLYFPNYYEAGILYPAIMAWTVLLSIYFLSQMLLVYRTAEPILKNRLRYLFTAILMGYLLGTSAWYLVFDIQIDPILSMFFVTSFVIPFTYAVLKYDLMDIKVIAKQAFTYSLAVVGVGIFIVLLNFSNQLIVQQIPATPAWALPLISSFIVVTVGFFIWKRLREIDTLKYEFVSTISHKLRTPLTGIKWAAESLTTHTTAEGQEELAQIKEGTNRLVELVGLLMNTSNDHQEDYVYHWEPVDIATLSEKMVGDEKYQAQKKNITLSYANQTGNAVMIHADPKKILSVIQIMIDNAIAYTPKDGKVEVTLSKSGSTALLTVKDTGIGLDKEDARLIFSRFFRGNKARAADTEGMGIGLFIAQRIVERHDGKISVKSEGVGTGSTFSLSLPLMK
ncbi:MAG: HAMP domain-containing sensor histidine kinase [Patescibacteria group bacterium]